MSRTIHVVIVDDHAPFREGLTDLLNAELDLRVVGQGGSAAEAVDLVQDLQPDIILLDLQMPGGGIPAAAQIARSQAQTRIAILTDLNEEDSVDAAREVGAQCYLLKGISARALACILRSLCDGRPDARCWPAPEALRT